MSGLEPPYQSILVGLSRGEVIPFLGSGASLPDELGDDPFTTEAPGRYPKADELASALARHTNYPEDAPRELALIAQYFDGIAGRTPLTRYLHDVFVCDHQSTKLHSFLAARMNRGIIITTNYDNLLERAFANKPYDLVIHATDAEREDRVWLLRAGADRPELVPPARLPVNGSERPLIYKMHGTADVRDELPDQFLITEDDYVDFLTRMTRQKVLPAPVKTGLMRSNVLFLGYGLRDWNVRVVLNGVTRQYDNKVRKEQGFKSWAIQHQVSTVEQINWQGRGVVVFPMTLTRFVDELEALAANESAGQHHD